MNQPTSVKGPTHAPHITTTAWRHKGKRRSEPESISMALDSGVRVRIAGHDVEPLGSSGFAAPNACFSPGFAPPFARRAPSRAHHRREVTLTETLPSNPGVVAAPHSAEQAVTEAPLPYAGSEDAPLLVYEHDLPEMPMGQKRIVFAVLGGIALGFAMIGLLTNLGGASTIVAGGLALVGIAMALFVAAR